MCGRFTLHTSIEDLVERFLFLEQRLHYIPSYNIAPTQQVLTVRSRADNRTASFMRWGLVSPWQKQGQSRPPLINARLETLAEKPTFRRLVNTNRCLIVADGFYEWKQEGTLKYPVYITLDGGRPFAFAGLWDDEAQPSCTIITQDASSALQSVHHRMPVILTPESEELWLSPSPFTDIQRKLPVQEGRPIQYHRVSTFVNSPRNNDSRCILPSD